MKAQSGSRRGAGGIGARLAALFASAALAWIALGLGATPARASGSIDIRVSIKIILNPVDGTRPPVSPGVAVGELHLLFMTAFANANLLGPTGRGYRFIITEVEDIGTPCTSCTIGNPSLWYDAAFGDNTTPLKSLEDQAKIDPDYLWRTNAANVYVNAGQGNGAISSFPPPDPRSNDITVVGAGCFAPGLVTGFAGGIFNHEMGHYFNLPHPNSSIDTCCNPSTCIGDGDGISDTVLDGPCFLRDVIAQANYGAVYANLTPVQRDSVDFGYWNNMAYLHPDQEPYGSTLLTLLTEKQMDRWTDTANDTRTGVRSGHTRFVCWGCGGTGTSASPMALTTAVSQSNAPDIVLLKQGNYPINPTWSAPMTFRATRLGPARIGN